MDEKPISRPVYIEKLKKFQGHEAIKVITGIRRCGKSCLMRLFIDELLRSGVPEGNIIHVNLEAMEFDSLRDYRELYRLLRDRMPAQGRAYIFLDEAQEIGEWERAINAIRTETNADIYITGSNAWLLSSEISTLLGGRYVEIPLLPLSFREYLDFTAPAAPADSGPAAAPSATDPGIEEKFNQYLKYGGFPSVPFLPQENETVNGYLSGIYNTVIVKDVLARSSLRDIKSFEQLVKFLAQNTGNYVSPHTIAGFISSLARGESLKSETVSRYLDYLEKAFVVYPAYRYDIKGKELLKTLCKYYVVDTGLRNMLLGYSGADYGAALETVVYLELLRRGFKVYVGKQYDREIDFFAERQDKKLYFQVSATLLDPATRERELRPLTLIKDNHEKVLLSMDKTFTTDYDGIRNRNIIEFLLEG